MIFSTCQIRRLCDVPTNNGSKQVDGRVLYYSHSVSPKKVPLLFPCFLHEELGWTEAERFIRSLGERGTTVKTSREWLKIGR